MQHRKIPASQAVVTVNKFHCILPFICPYTGISEPAMVWFCNVNCKDKFVQVLSGLRKVGVPGSLVERFFALMFNANNQCAHCEQKIK